MSDVPKVYRPVYQTRGIACFLVIREDRTPEEYKADMHFITGIRRDSVQYIGQPIKPGLIKPRLYLCRGKLTDFAYSDAGLITFNQKVVDTFGGELEEYGELYPVDFAEEPYYLYRVTRMVEAMDIEKVAQSDYRYKGKKNYDWQMYSFLYEFIPKNISSLLIFKDINQTPPRSVFFGQRFIDIVKRHKLTGLNKDTFKPLWPCPERQLTEKNDCRKRLILAVDFHLKSLLPDSKKMPFDSDISQFLGYLPPEIESKIMQCQDVRRMSDAKRNIPLDLSLGLDHDKIMEILKDL